MGLFSYLEVTLASLLKELRARTHYNAMHLPLTILAANY